MVLAALPQDTIRLIKSTQVITTPASIVKELTENSLDAAATTVSVKLEKFGFLRLEVRDNGSGIHEDDVQFIAKPHFTSKISAFADLFSLTSFGFRGEALSSLCAVADVTVTTKTKENPMGHMYTFNHCGEVTSKKPAATPNGTTVVVSNLFKNVPVRHQYYSNRKHCKDELKKVEDIMFGLSFAVPNVHLTLSHDRAIVFQKNASHDLRSVLMNVFPDVGKNLKSKSKHMENVTLEVFLPERKCSAVSCYSRSSSDRLLILINRRPVNYKVIEKMTKAYFSQGSDGCHGRYPVGLITISVSPEALDVNLEPNKNKVLLKEEDVLLDALKAILEELYGPLEKNKNNSDKTHDSTDVGSCGDITCTFANVSQPDVDSRSTNCNVERRPKNPSDSACIDDMDDDDIFHLSSGDKIQTNPNPSGKPKPNNVDLNGKKFTFQTLQAKSNKDENVCVAPKVVIGRGTEDVGRSLFSGETGEKDRVQRLSTSFDNVTDGKSSRMASTPAESKSDALPQLSLSTIHSSGNSQNPTLKSDNLNLSVGLEGINSVSSELTFIPESNEVIMMDVNKKPSCDESGDSSRMHESVVGEDGIPVFKIAPFMSPCIEATGVTEEPHASINKENIHENTHSVPKPVCIENKSSNNEKILHMHENENNNTENPQAAVGKQGTWSRGNIIENGDNIQTVQLLKPQNGTLAGTSKSHIKGNDGKRHLSPVSEGKDSSGTPPKKTKLNSLGPASFDYVHSKPVKRPSSAFILFSRDIRLEVLSQNPGKDFAWVAKEMADRWRALDFETKKHYQDMAKEDSERYQREVRKIKELRGLNTSLNTTLDKGMGGRTTLDRYVAPLTPQLIKKEGKIVQQQPFVSKTPWKEHSKDWNVTTDIIRDKLYKRQKSVSRDNDVRLIGPLGMCGGWTCLISGVVNAFNTSRLHETILCHNLFQSFKLPASDLKDPVPFNASVIGDSNWALLMKLKLEKVESRNMYTVTDRRITMNGFKITLYPSSGNPAVFSHGEITGLSNSIGFYGISDFKEILSVLVANPFATVSQTRPLKLQFWLKGESVRMVRSGSNMLSQESVLEKLSTWREIQKCSDANDNVLWEEAKCIHDKLIFTPLYSLDDLPLSQSQTQNTQES